MEEWFCSVCGTKAYYDGRCGDDPILVCGCDQGELIKDRIGEYHDNPTGAKPVQVKQRKKAGAKDHRKK